MWHRLELGGASTYVLVRGDEVAVIDAGLAGSETKLEPELQKLGYEWSDIDHVVTTHRHPDHDVQDQVAATGMQRDRTQLG